MNLLNIKTMENENQIYNNIKSKYMNFQQPK